MIQLTDDFRIRFDISDNVTLEQLLDVEKKSKETVKEWKLAGYFPNIRAAVKYAFNLEMNKSESLTDLFNRLDKIERKVDEIFSMRFSPLFNAHALSRSKN